MMRRFLILLLFSSGLFASISGQQLNFIKYSLYDGMVANTVRCIYQDSKGFIWIGTFEGLSRYDGYKFTNYTNINGLSHNVVNSIYEVDGKLLIAENNGAVDIIQNNSIQDGWMAGSAVNFIAPYKDRLLLATDNNGFYAYNGDTINLPKQELTGTTLGHFMALGDSMLLCDAVDNGIVIFNKNLTVHFYSKAMDVHFYNLFRDSKQRIWGCSSGGLKLLEIEKGEKWSVSYAPLPKAFNFPILSQAQVTSMVEEKDGSLWIGTVKGLVHIFPDGNYHVYNEKEGLPSAIIQTLTLDRENNLWVGTALGLAKWVSKNNVVFFNTEYRDFKNDVNSIYTLYNNKFVMGTSHGIQQFDMNTREFKDLKGIGHHYEIPVQKTFPLLVHAGDKLGILDSSTGTINKFKNLEPNKAGVLYAIQHPDGNIFLGKFSGLEIIEGTSIRKLIPHRITSMTIDYDGNVWAGTWESGLYKCRRKNSGDKIYIVQDVTYLTKEKSIRSLYSDSKKNIWIGTRYAGAFCLTPKSNSQFDIQQFNRGSGLMSDWVSAFGETPAGDMWIGSYQGIDKLVKTSSGYRVFNFSKAVNFFAEIKAIAPAANNEWVCVANSGIAYFKDENLHQTAPFQPSILSASLGVHANKLTIYAPTEKVTLSPNQNAARFEFSALGFINERQILYSYRLLGGGDTTWSKPENVHEAYYASLSPGDYTFEVKTIGWNGEHGTTASFSFFIRSPFWQKWWFIGLTMLAIATFFYGLYRFRIRQILRLQRVRNNIATDLHDDIGASLTNISILSELGTKNLSEPGKALPFLQRISEEVQSSSQAMDDIIWSVNSRNDSLQETIARMRRYAAELFDNSNSNCHLQLDETSGNKKLSIEQRRDVYLIYKEALNNIHKHAHAKNVWIRVSQNQNHLYMQIKDDGKGFNTNLKTHRNGLKNLRSRVEKWNGKIKIESLENQGTMIEVRIPIKD